MEITRHFLTESMTLRKNCGGSLVAKREAGVLLDILDLSGRSAGEGVDSYCVPHSLSARREMFVP